MNGLSADIPETQPATPRITRAPEDPNIIEAMTTIRDAPGDPNTIEAMREAMRADLQRLSSELRISAIPEAMSRIETLGPNMLALVSRALEEFKNPDPIKPRVDTLQDINAVIGVRDPAEWTEFLETMREEAREFITRALTQPTAPGMTEKAIQDKKAIQAALQRSGSELGISDIPGAMIKTEALDARTLRLLAESFAEFKNPNPDKPRSTSFRNAGASVEANRKWAGLPKKERTKRIKEEARGFITKILG